MLKETNKGEPLNEDMFMGIVWVDDVPFAGKAWKEKGKWYFIQNNKVYEVDDEDIMVNFRMKMKQPLYH